MAYPKMEDVSVFSEDSWLRSLVQKASKFPNGLDSTVFKTQAFDWKKDKWISSSTVNQWLRILVAAGAYHIAYYPDDYIGNRPDLKTISDMISSRYFPYENK